MNLLIIDPGSTSTKIGVSIDGVIHKFGVSHSTEEICACKKIVDQKKFRFNYINNLLKENGFTDTQFDAVIGRGGLIKPVQGGVYKVNPLMEEHLSVGLNGEHASNLGGLLASQFADKYDCVAFIADPVVVDEMEAVAKFSGLKGIERQSIFHALNQKAMARKTAELIGAKYEEINLIVVHMGGGITVGAHKKGKVVDVNNGLSGDGPFAPERSGGLPVSGIISYLETNNCSYEEFKKKVAGEGGVYSYTGIKDIQELEKKIIEGDESQKLVLSAMVYQIVKEIGSLAASLGGNVDGIVLTGGIAHSKMVTEKITEKVKFISEIYLLPGEFEIEDLAASAKRALENPEIVKVYC